MKPYIPKQIPPVINWQEIVPLIGKANAALAKYDGLLHGVINPAVLLSPLMLQESVLSSKIEGTQATLGEVLKYEAGQEYTETKNQDIREVVNYRTALFKAKSFLNKRPLNLNMIRDLHFILLDGVRGSNKGRGKFRQIQNWVGTKNCPIERAIYIPPPPSQILKHLHLWEKYIHEQEKDILVQLAIIHAQFEIIHPFIDGNGRIGRMLIPLFLYAKGALSQPAFYLSEYFEFYKDEYYDSLKGISTGGKWQNWLKFFLNAVIVQAKANISKAAKIQKLYQDMKELVVQITRSQYSLAAMDAIFYRPIFNSASFLKKSKIPRQTGLLILRNFKKNKILKEISPASGRKSAIYIFPRLVNTAEGREVA